MCVLCDIGEHFQNDDDDNDDDKDNRNMSSAITE